MPVPVTTTPTGIDTPAGGVPTWWRARAVGLGPSAGISAWTAPEWFTVRVSTVNGGDPLHPGPVPPMVRTGQFTVTTNGQVTAIYNTAWTAAGWTPYTKVL